MDVSPVTDWWQQEVAMTRAQLQAERDAARQVGEHNGTLRAWKDQWRRLGSALRYLGDTTVSP